MIGATRRRRRNESESAAALERFRWQFEFILEGARRAERPFSMTQFTCRSVPEAEELHHLCLESTRVCDAVGIERTNVIVVWDSTATAPATRAARRLLTDFADSVGADCKVSTVGFPNAGYTPAALIRSLVLAPSDPAPSGPAPSGRAPSGRASSDRVLDDAARHDTSTAHIRRSPDRLVG